VTLYPMTAALHTALYSLVHLVTVNIIQ